MFWKRAAVIVSGAMAVLLVAALAYAANGADDTSTATSTTAAAPASGSQVFAAGTAGDVRVSAGSGGLAVDAVDPAAGWVFEVEVPAGREVEVKFVDGSERIDFRAELEDGQIKARTENDTQTDDDRSTSFSTAAAGETLSYDAGEAGRVQIRRTGTGLELVDASPAAGWVVAKIETEMHEVEVEFRNGATELEFKAELEDGIVRTRTEITVDDDGQSSDDSSTVGDDNGGSGISDDDPAVHDVNDDNGGAGGSDDDPAIHDVNDDNGGDDDPATHDVDDDSAR